VKLGARLAALAVFLSGTVALAEAQRFVQCEGASFRYLLDSPPGNRARPAVVVLHGSGDNGTGLFHMWQQFAQVNGIILIAPTLPRAMAFEKVAPAVFRCIVEDAKTAAKIDPNRIYVVGHSMGGYLAYDAAMFESEYFAAVVVHAAAIDEDFVEIVDRARRKIPIAIFIGDRDQLVPIESVRKTRDLLTKAGFPVEYEELKGHDHFYEGAVDQINRKAWKFLEAHPLPDTPADIASPANRSRK
jgi:predicted esterase